MVCLWGAGWGVLFYLSPLKPFEVTAIGFILGIIGGLMQQQGFQEKPNEFLNAQTMFEVRAALKGTVWGRRYLLFLKIAALLLVVVAFVFQRNILTDVLTGYLAMMFLRELITLSPTAQLEKLAASQGGEAP